MLTRAAFLERFGPRAVFGMIHLAPLPGSPLFRSWDEVVGRAARDAAVLSNHGCDGVVFENFGDRPFAKGRVEAETIAAMTRVITIIENEIKVPYGVNVLRNDALSALAIAAATRAAFIRVNVHTGAMVTDQGIVEGDAYTTLRKRAALAPHVLIFADYLVKHATPLGEQSPKDLRLRGLADAVIVSGSETGAAADPSRLAFLRREIPDAPVLVGSGLSEHNAHTFQEADGAIVGTAFQVEGKVDLARVERVVRTFKR